MIPKARRLSFQFALWTTGLFSLAAVVIVSLVQISGGRRITEKCSYLDPIAIDLLAFAAAVFLVVEGFHQLLKHEQSFSRADKLFIALRIAFGFAILTLHIIQAFYK